MEAGADARFGRVCEEPPCVAARACVDWLAGLFEKTEHVDQDLTRVRQLLRGLHPA
ncbi:MAG: Probable transcription regulator protein of MDR efflux pump cluster [uncultured Paraburkholderia sp.]|nr:MAG: Probable transcription regulator protein of MDR efflux pump cluster [uncultured Paraburkholderia sp.]CAH2933211.1 MAG: Probable transcription regulator protein of MDR efflux pump cluster [uncultured Paraburkholderia sp.]